MATSELTITEFRTQLAKATTIMTVFLAVVIVYSLVMNWANPGYLNSTHYLSFVAGLWVSIVAANKAAKRIQSESN